ncbi:hypothetical protein ACMFMG_000321 [Clarireedia jacksonii]
MHHVASFQLRNEPSPAPAPPVETLQSNPGCVSLSSALNICESATPSFTNLSPTQQASCLCYSRTSWCPTNFDHAVANCAQFAFTALPGAYSVLANLEGFCSSAGNVKTPPSATASLTAFISPVSVDKSCYTAFSLLQVCNNLIPGFLALDPTQQASCLCYASATSWAPKTFDDAVSTCSNYAHTAASDLVVSISSFDGLCTSVGDVLLVPLGRTSADVPSLTLGSAATTDRQLTLSVMLSPSPASGPTIDGLIPTTMMTSSNSRSTVSRSSSTINVRPTTSAAVIDGDQDGDISLKEVSDPMVVAEVCQSGAVFVGWFAFGGQDLSVD